MGACFASVIAFVASERTLAGMNTLVQSQSAVFFAPISAFVAGEWKLTRVFALV